MCDFHLGTNGWPQDFECVNGVAIDIDCYVEGTWDAVYPAPCHPHYCRSCMGTGEIEVGNVDYGCDDCGGTGFTNEKFAHEKDDLEERLKAHADGCDEAEGGE